MKALVTTMSDLACMPWPNVRAVADSAIARQRDPIWLDTESGEEFTALVCPVYRIGRLGLNIEARFAGRYIDAIGLTALVLPNRIAASPLAAPEIHFLCNGAMVMGDELEPSCFGEGQLTIMVEYSEGDKQSSVSDPDFPVQALARLSKLMTFKTGDRLVDVGAAVPVRLSPRFRFSATLDARLLLQAKAL